jgi:hypothetical protein
MNTQFELTQRAKIEATLNVPLDRWHIINETSQVLRYIKNGELKLIYHTQLEAAEFFKAVGYIDSFEITEQGLKMYNKVLYTLAFDNGAPVQYERNVIVRWDEIFLTPVEVAHFAAKHEYDAAAGAMGILYRAGETMGKVVSMVNKQFKKRA